MYHTAGYHDNVVLDPLQFADVPEPAEDCFHDAGEDVCLEHEYFEHEDIQDEPHDLKSTADLHVPEHVLAQRLLRTRERNRAAQARYRYKIKAECEQRAVQIAATQGSLSDTRRRRELLQETREALAARLAAATRAKLAAVRCDTSDNSDTAPPVGNPPRKPSRNVLPVATRLLLARRGAARGGVPPAAHTSVASDPGTALLARHAHLATPPSRHVFKPPPLMPPPLASFRRHTRIAYADLRAASGSQTAAIDFGDASAWELMNQCMAAAVRRLGCAPGEVCWFAQMEMDVGAGPRMSYSCTLSTPECVTSCVLFLQALNLEAALISAAHKLPGFRGEPNFSHSGGVRNNEPEGSGQRSPKRYRPVAGTGPAPSQALAAEVAQMHMGSGATDGDEPPGEAAEGLRSGCWCAEVTGGACVRLRCGVNETRCASAAVRHLVRGFHTRYSARVPAATVRDIFSAIRRHTEAMFDMPPPDDADGGGAEEPAASVVEYRHFLASVSESVFMVMKMLVATVAELQDETLAARDRTSSSAQEAAESGGGADAGGDGDAAELEERISAALVSMCMGYQLVQRNAPRIIWSLIAAAVFPRDNFLEVEKFHVHIYRLLGLSEQQKDLYAANWSLWSQRRKANDEHTAEALQQLAAVPTSIALPLPFMLHISAAAAGTLHDDALDFDRSTLDRHERRALTAGPPLLGASADGAAAAGAAVRTLWTMHHADALMITETIDLQIQPGALLEAPQIAQAFGVHLLHGSTPIDFMTICRLADRERRRAAAAHIPDICGAAALPGAVPQALLSDSQGTNSHVSSSNRPTAAPGRL